MHLAHSRKDSEQPPEQLFAAKYAWLLRWALQFTENDRDAAEDLVQDTFVRVLLTWETLHTLHDLEPLLYSYLKYAHLSERRRKQRNPLQSTMAVDADTLAASLGSNSLSEQLEVQSELRSILSYLLWRRNSAKFASIFLLRFFHGFYPEEIASLVIASRHSVDLSLRQARSELKAHLLESKDREPSARNRLVDPLPREIPVRHEEFADELRREIFISPRGQCPSDVELTRHYSSLNGRSIELNLLAHLVVCKACLTAAASFAGTPPPEARTTEDSFSSAPRDSASRKPSLDERAALARIFARGWAEVREAVEHDPLGLSIALNGETAAERDINSSRAILRIETHSIETLSLVEVFSTQGVLLLTLPILHRPPQIGPEVKRQLSLSDDRLLRLVLEYSHDSIAIEVIYDNPHFVSMRTKSASSGLVARSSEINLANPPSSPELTRYARIANQLGAVLNSLFAQDLRRVPAHAVLTGVGIVLLLGVGATAWHRSERARDRALFQNTLDQLQKSELAQHAKHVTGATHQQLQIKTNGRVMLRDVYRDIEGLRKPKQVGVMTENGALDQESRRAEFNWRNPLSEQDFERWRKSLEGAEDQVEPAVGGVLVLTTSSPNGPVLRESLTVRVKDSHPIARTIEFRDAETIEVAEVSYQVVPWGPVSNSWFDPISASSPDASRRTDSGHLTPKLDMIDESAIDFAMLSAMSVIQELNGDTERLEIVRSDKGVTVEGVVATNQRKNELVNRLATIPNVQCNILSYLELDATDTSSSASRAVRAESVVSGVSQLDRYCTSVHKTQDECRLASYRLLNLATTIVRESKRIEDLRLRFVIRESSDQRVQLLMTQLLNGRIGQMRAALADQQTTIAALGFEAGSSSTQDSANGFTTLVNAAYQNLKAVRELVYSSDEASRSAQEISEDLVRSIQQVQVALLQIPSKPSKAYVVSTEVLTSHSQ